MAKNSTSRQLNLLLAIAMAAGLVACGGSGDGADASDGSSGGDGGGDVGGGDNGGGTDNGGGDNGGGTVAVAGPTIATGGLGGEYAGGYTLAVMADGRVLVLGGRASYGDYPLGFATPTTPLADTSARVVDGLKAKSVAAGGVYALAIGQDGRLYGWGRSEGGTLGGRVVNGSVTVPREVEGAGNDVVMAVAGSAHAVALEATGQVVHWPGSIDYQSESVTMGRVGNLSGVERLVRGPVTGVDGSYDEPIAIGADGRAWTLSWAFGIDATARATHTAVVREITGVEGVADMACGEYHCLALLRDGTLKAWGSNRYGQLGNGTTVDSGLAIPSGGTTAAVSPSGVAGLADVRSIAATASASVAVTRDGSLWTWGQDYNGQSDTAALLVPTKVDSVTNAVEVSCVVHSPCVVRLASGELLSWGINANGELGDGTTTAQRVPVRATGVDLD